MRVLSVLTLLTLIGARASAEPDYEQTSPAVGSYAQSAPARRSKSRKKFSGYAIAESKLRQARFDRPSGDLYMYSPNWKEEVKVNIYNADGSFNEDALRELSWLLRCKRTDTQKPIEPHLFEVLSAIQDHFGGKRMLVLSGFRNQRKVTSYHFHGTAADIHIEGVSDRQLCDFASSLDDGGMGVGIYPRSHFVHVDVRPAPSFRWVDYSTGGDGNVGRLPPRGFKRQRQPES